MFDTITCPVWKNIVEYERQKPYFRKILEFLDNEIAQWCIFYPPREDVFRAFSLTPFSQVKVVTLWQDPYHWPGQAHWLAFSVPDNFLLPPSLQNIFKEIHGEKIDCILPPVKGGEKVEWSLGGLVNRNGDLTNWAAQWVLLLNTTLTVRARAPLSHAGIWWEIFTDAVIHNLSKQKEWLIFLLWWNHARKKKILIDTSKHHILEAPHPSPLSAHSGFFGCGHFMKTNEILRERGEEEIQW